VLAGSRPSAPQRLVALVQSMLPSLKLDEASCTSSIEPPCSGVVIGMRIGSENSVSMFGTVPLAATLITDLAAFVWHW
jgi:hypothetical protein